MTTVLVTGASGALGTAVLERLRGRRRTRALVHRRPADADECVRGDLVTGEGLDEALDGVRAIVHLAAVTHARRPRAYEAVNAAGTRRLVEAAARAGAERIVHVSTRAIDPRGGAYSASKASAEAVVRSSGVPWVILRLAEVYGGGGREGIDALVGRARSGRTLPLVGDGSQEVCPLFVDDAVTAIVSGLERDVTGRTYTLGGDCLTLEDFARRCAAAFGDRSRIVHVPQPVVALASAAARFLPLPLAPDQLARLRAPKERPSPDAQEELGVAPLPLADGLRHVRARW